MECGKIFPDTFSGENMPLRYPSDQTKEFPSESQIPPNELYNGQKSHPNQNLCSCQQSNENPYNVIEFDFDSK